MTIELRRVTADDWEAWRAVRLAALAEAPTAFGSTHADWAEAPEHRWRTRLSIPGALDLVAYEDGARPVGLATGVPNPDGPDPDGRDHAELISMWVDPAARGRGIARSLIAEIADWAAASGVSALELAVMPDNTVARRAYEHSGFTVADTLGDALPDGRHEVVMRRDLIPEHVAAGPQEAGRP